MLDFYVKTGIRFSLRDKQLFEITEVEITRVDCIVFENFIKSGPSYVLASYFTHLSEMVLMRTTTRVSMEKKIHYAVLQIRRGNMDNLGIGISP